MLWRHSHKCAKESCSSWNTYWIQSLRLHSAQESSVKGHERTKFCSCSAHSHGLFVSARMAFFFLYPYFSNCFYKLEPPSCTSSFQRWWTCCGPACWGITRKTGGEFTRSATVLFPHPTNTCSFIETELLIMALIWFLNFWPDPIQIVSQIDPLSEERCFSWKNALIVD